MHIYIVNGAPGCGKTTFEEIVHSIYEDTHILSVIDPIKIAAKILGWDGNKEEGGRLLLCNLKDWADKNLDSTHKYIKNSLRRISKTYEVFDVDDDMAIVFIDAREIEDIEYFKKKYGAKSVFINREIEYVPTCHADQINKEYEYDIYINNLWDEDTLKKAARDFLNMEGIKIPQ